MTVISLDRFRQRVDRADTLPVSGRVIRTVGLVVESRGPRARVGEICELIGEPGMRPLPLEVVGFREGTLLTVPLGGTSGIRPGDRIVSRGLVSSMAVGPGLLGRVIDGLGRPLDSKGDITAADDYPLYPPP